MLLKLIKLSQPVARFYASQSVCWRTQGQAVLESILYIAECGVSNSVSSAVMVALLPAEMFR
jgi:hypothetical protein